METFQTSFIPKKPLVTNSLVSESAPRTRMGFIMFLSLILLISMIIATIVLYFYKGSLSNGVTNLQESISVAKDSFQPESVSELQLFNKRMSASKQIISAHLILSPVFSILSDLTIPSIQFTKFNVEPGIDGKNFVVRMSGLAKDYKSIAVQSQEFNTPSGKYFKDVIFSNLVLQTDKINKGYVGFDTTFTVDPVLLSYDKNVLTNNSAPR